MPLPYENATSGEKALGEIQNILRQFGCQKFGSWLDFETGELTIQFEWNKRQVELRASSKGYAAAWLKNNPWTNRKQKTKQEWEMMALEKGSIAVYSILRDWVKGQTTAIETGILTFECAFLGHMLLPNGQRFIDNVTKLLEKQD